MSKCAKKLEAILLAMQDKYLDFDIIFAEAGFGASALSTFNFNITKFPERHFVNLNSCELGLVLL